MSSCPTRFVSAMLAATTLTLSVALFGCQPTTSASSPALAERVLQNGSNFRGIPRQRLVGDPQQVLLAQGAALHAQLQATGQGFVSAVFDAQGQSFNRVGLRVDALVNESTVPGIEASASEDGQEFAAFTPAKISYRDGQAFNAYVDLPEGTRAVQLRFSNLRQEELSFVFAEVFEFASVRDSDQGAQVAKGPDANGQAGLGLKRSALAADGVAIPRSTWGARTTYCSYTHTPVRIAIHHTVTPNNDSYDMPRRVRQIQAYHMDTRGWCDVGYHFLIGQDGEVYQARVESQIGAHVLNHNTGTAGISFIGDFTSIVPSQAMLDAGSRIIHALSSTYGISIDRTSIKGHREFSGAATACPGDSFFPTLDSYIGAVAGGGGGPAVTKGTLRGTVFWGSDFGVDINDPSKRLVGASVSVSGASSATGSSDASGWYSLNLVPGSYSVTVSMPGYSSQTLTKTVASGTTTWGSIMLQPGTVAVGTVKGVVFWGTSSADYSINVSDPAKRIAGATVHFAPGGQSVTTDASGWYETQLPVGSYAVSASASGYTDGQRADPVPVTANAISWGSTMVLKDTGIGVEDQDAPVLTLVSPSEGAALDQALTQVVGSVSDASAIAWVRVNGVDVSVSGGDFRQTLTLLPGQNVITVAAADEFGNQASQSVTVTLVGSERAGVRGFVYDAGQGEAVRVIGARLSFTGASTRSIESDSAGAFDADLPEGSYQLSLEADGYELYTDSVAVVAGSRTRLSIGLQRAGSAESELQITFPAEGQLIAERRIVVTGALGVGGELGGVKVARLVVSGEDAALSEGSFSAEVKLAKGANLIIATAFASDGSELGRASVHVVRKAGAMSCNSSSEGSASLLPVVLATGLLLLWPLLSDRRRRGQPRASR